VVDSTFSARPSRRWEVNITIDFKEIIRMDIDKSLAFPICGTTKIFFFYGLKKLEQRSHKCVELRGEYVE
jgi:hypothetical protein